MTRFVDGYACGADGKRVVFYDCDPQKNIGCKKTMCAFGGDWQWKRGHCDKTTEKDASRDGSKPFYIKQEKKGARVVFVREYIEEAKP